MKGCISQISEVRVVLGGVHARVVTMIFYQWCDLETRLCTVLAVARGTMLHGGTIFSGEGVGPTDGPWGGGTKPKVRSWPALLWIRILCVGPIIFGKVSPHPTPAREVLWGQGQP